MGGCKCTAPPRQIRSLVIVLSRAVTQRSRYAHWLPLCSSAYPSPLVCVSVCLCIHYRLLQSLSTSAVRARNQRSRLFPSRLHLGGICGVNLYYLTGFRLAFLAMDNCRLGCLWLWAFYFVTAGRTVIPLFPLSSLRVTVSFSQILRPSGLGTCSC